MGMSYVWGSIMTGMYLARTRPAAIADLGSYEYLVKRHGSILTFRRNGGNSGSGNAVVVFRSQ